MIPPKEWWEKTYAEVRERYARPPTARRKQITDPKSLSAITGSIWWKLEPGEREYLVEYYDKKASLKRNGTKATVIDKKKKGVVSQQLKNGKYIVYAFVGMPAFIVMGSAKICKDKAEAKEHIDQMTATLKSKNPQGFDNRLMVKQRMGELPPGKDRRNRLAVYTSGVPSWYIFVPMPQPGVESTIHIPVHGSRLKRGWKKQLENPLPDWRQEFRAPKQLRNPSFLGDATAGLALGIGWTAASFLVKEGMKKIQSRKKK